MKKIMMLAVVALSVIACNKETAATANAGKTASTAAGFKTAYIDTEELMKEYQEFKDFEAKFKTMSDKMKNELDTDAKRFQNDVVDLQKNAQSKGMEWAQKRQAELERRQQTLAEKEQNYMKKFQEESAVERDSMVSKMKTFIKDYGKEQGYDYIYGTGDAASVLYGKEEYNLTKEVLALLHKQYEEKTGKKVEVKEETKKEEVKKTETKK